ncbi:MAG: L,D-transpeptidase family protein [Bacillota bacterium]
MFRVFGDFTALRHKTNNRAQQHCKLRERKKGGVSLIVLLVSLLLVFLPLPALAGTETGASTAVTGTMTPAPEQNAPALFPCGEALTDSDSIPAGKLQSFFQSLTSRWIQAVTGQQEANPATILIDVHRRRLLLFCGRRLHGSYPVAVGKPGTPTPVGNWQISRKAMNWGTGFGTRWIGLNVPWGIYGIHGTNKPWSIGGYESGGCIRMFNEDVETVYPLVRAGTPVIIVGDVLRGPRHIRQGDNGCDVIEVQRVLKRWGFYDGPIDGRFEQPTIDAVRRFRKAHRLPLLDDVVDDDVYRLLGL